jgi:transposase
MWTTRVELDHQVVTLSGQGLGRRAIARALGVSRNTVRKILEAHGHARRERQAALAPPPERVPRPQKIDDFRGKVTELLTRFPDITAQRIFEELRAAGYGGSYTQVKRHVRGVRPPPHPEPSMPTPSFGPGEMAESDWSPYMIDFLDGQRTKVQALSYVLVWSRRKCFFVYERCDLHALMDGHVAAFERLGGAAAACKYDSQKPVVLGWEGQQPIYNPRYLAFATHYEFAPQAVRRFHPNDKPRTERSLWEFERSFLNGRRFRDLDDMRAQLAVWCDGTCDHRRRLNKLSTPLERFVEEKPYLKPLPAHAYDTARVVYRVCSIDGFVALDGNRYAVPYDHVTDIVPVRVTQAEVFIYAADLKLVARHPLAPRGAGRDVAPPGTHQPWKSRGADLDQLKQAFAAIGEGGALFFAGLTTAQHRLAGYHARQILLLRERYSTADIGAALMHARSFGAFEHGAIERILAARAAPRRLAEYVAEETARKLNELPGDHDTFLRDLDEYDRLPGAGSAKEPPCPSPDESSPQPQDPIRSSSDSDDTSNCSD